MLLVLCVYIFVTFILVAHLYPHNMVTYTRQELFSHNIASVTGGKLPYFPKQTPGGVTSSHGGHIQTLLVISAFRDLGLSELGLFW